jgi:hypothetical protein
MLIYKRLIRSGSSQRDADGLTRRNSAVAKYFWIFTALYTALATLVWNNTILLMFFSLIFCGLYVWLYWRITRFNSPRWLITSASTTPAVRCPS